MTPEGIAWQILKGNDGMDRDRAQFTGQGRITRGAKRMRPDSMKVTGLAGYGNKQVYPDVGLTGRRGYSRTGQRNAERRMVFDETERAQQRPVDSEFDSQEDEEQQDMTADRAGLGTATRSHANAWAESCSATPTRNVIF